MVPDDCLQELRLPEHTLDVGDRERVEVVGRRVRHAATRQRDLVVHTVARDVGDLKVVVGVLEPLADGVGELHFGTPLTPRTFAAKVKSCAWVTSILEANENLYFFGRLCTKVATLKSASSLLSA